MTKLSGKGVAPEDMMLGSPRIVLESAKELEARNWERINMPDKKIQPNYQAAIREFIEWTNMSDDPDLKKHGFEWDQPNAIKRFDGFNQGINRFREKLTEILSKHGIEAGNI